MLRVPYDFQSDFVKNSISEFYTTLILGVGGSYGVLKSRITISQYFLSFHRFNNYVILNGKWKIKSFNGKMFWIWKDLARPKWFHKYSPLIRELCSGIISSVNRNSRARLNSYYQNFWNFWNFFDLNLKRSTTALTIWCSHSGETDWADVSRLPSQPSPSALLHKSIVGSF